MYVYVYGTPPKCIPLLALIGIYGVLCIFLNINTIKTKHFYK